MAYLNNIQLRILSEFLDDTARPQGTMNLHELRGFLWGLASAPLDVPEEDWLPFVFEGDEPNFRNDAEEEKIVDLLVALFDETFERIEDEETPFPGDDYRWSDAGDKRWPLSAWCTGLLKAHYWQEDHWNALLDNVEPIETEDGVFDMLQEVENTLNIAATFGDIDSAMLETDAPDELLAELPELAEQLPWVMMNYAECGGMLYEVMQTQNSAPYQRETPKIGRNDPCFCGSGKKYKHCCLNAANDE